MELKSKKRIVIEVDYNDLENVIKDYYGHDFEIVADQEVGNESTLNIMVKKKELDKWSTKDMEEFQNTGRGNFMLYKILTDLCNNDVIEEGQYIISIFLVGVRKGKSNE